MVTICRVTVCAAFITRYIHIILPLLFIEGTGTSNGSNLFLKGGAPLLFCTFNGSNLVSSLNNCNFIRCEVVAQGLSVLLDFTLCLLLLKGSLGFSLELF